MGGDDNQLRRRALMASVSAGITSLAGCQSLEGPLRMDIQKDREDWLNGIKTYDGEIVDWTGRETVSVKNGSGPNGWYFDPPAIRIDVGTTVVWEWTADTSRRDVIHANPKGEERLFESKLTDSDTHEYSYTFQQPGEHRYYCKPHQALNARGLVIVEDSNASNSGQQGGSRSGTGSGGRTGGTNTGQQGGSRTGTQDGSRTGTQDGSRTGTQGGSRRGGSNTGGYNGGSNTGGYNGGQRNDGRTGRYDTGRNQQDDDQDDRY